MSPSEPPPREVLAIAVALAVALQEAEARVAEQQPAAEPGRWRLSGRTYRWS
jgi:hypothetical protein